MTYRKSDIYKHYADRNVNTKVEEAIDCPTCNQAIIAKMNLTNYFVELFDFDSYLDNRQIPHNHPADHRTRARILERIATNKRLLEDRDQGDFNYASRREMN